MAQLVKLDKKEPLLFEVQTRSEVNGIKYHPTLDAAMYVTTKDNSIWKISFPIDSGERVRLIRSRFGEFILEQIVTGIDPIR